MESLSINRRIFALAIPAIFNNITVPLLGLSDTTIAGHLGSPVFLGAMAVGSMMLNVIFWLCGFLRMGTTGLTSQAFGAGDFYFTRRILRKAITIALAIGAIVLCLQRPLEFILFKIISPDAEISETASLYFRICLWGAPAQLVIMAVSGWFIGLQNTVVPMVIAVGVNIINILLSVSLVFVFGTGFEGVAIGTLVANWIGCLAAAIFCLHRIRKQKQNPVEEIQSTTVFSSKLNFFSVNTNLFFRSACIMIVTLAMTSFGARIGQTTLAANAVIMQFFLFFSYFMDGFAFAGEAIVGSSLGAKDYGLLRRCVKTLLLWGAVMAAVFLLIYAFFTSRITSLLTVDRSVRDAVTDMHLWLVLMPLITVAAFIFDGIFIGLARTGALLWTTVLASAVFFIVVYAPEWSDQPLTNTVLWTGFGCYLLLRGILLAADYVKLQRNSLIL